MKGAASMIRYQIGHSKRSKREGAIVVKSDSSKSYMERYNESRERSTL